MIKSDVYRRLVEDRDDVIGQVAYGVYKQAKQEFIRRKQEELNSDVLPDSVMEEFVANQTDYMLSLYRVHAQKITREFLDSYYEKDMAEIREKSERDTHAAIANFIKNFEPKSWWYGVFQSFVASFLFLFAGYVILKMSGSWDILLTNLFK